MMLLKPITLKFLERIKISFHSMEEYCFALAIFGLINFTAQYGFDQEYPLPLLKTVWLGLSLSSSLIIADYIPRRLMYIKKIFWNFCIIYILCFFSISQLFFTYASAQSLLNIVLSVFLLIVITDWLVATLFLIIGLLVSLLYLSLFHWHHVDLDYYLRGYMLLRNHLYMTFYFVWALIIATVFLRKIDKKRENFLLKRQLNITQIIASSIAHELRTPLLTIRATVEGLKRFTPLLINSYEKAKAQGVAVEPIPHDFYNALKTSLDVASNEITITNTIINILLMRLRGNHHDQNKIETFNISTPIAIAIERYPFDLSSQKKLIHVNLPNDFPCKAIKLLLIHVIFNLLKNSLYHIRKAKKGKIMIWSERHDNKNILYFKDTGTGINKKNLPLLFDEFFSMTTNGTGVGLTFCKLVMNELGGAIKVDSIEDEHTTFILIFPKITPDNEAQLT